MSTDVYGAIAKRSGTQTFSGIRLQRDNLSVQEAAYYGGAAPYQRYAVYIYGLYSLQQNDLLIDLNTTDPKTNNPIQYRVINDPEQFPDLHMELVVDHVRGT